ncbi:4,5-DOPA dioxygenase extradiol [Ferruginibacter yonginensis]|uniref:4,5-DOPA dioxygenase extradiol n=1 Tax=Ferruginibacter yonginensis TaxID=1310416 RepID=A0ABV8QQV7_9BACT
MMVTKLLDDLNDSFGYTATMPVLFLGHGSPMNAIEENQFVAGFRNIATTKPKPNAILCVSAHWYTNGTKVTAMDMPATIHDFGGFPKALFDVQYPAKGNPNLALITKNILTPTPVLLDDKWGLDHGAWSVIKHLYPLADIPVVQLSIDYTKPADYHFELAKKLQSLRNKGILIIGSGNIVHNLSMVDWAQLHKVNYGYDWAIEASTLINKYLVEGNVTPLLQYEKQGKAFQLAIPTPEHYLPLIYALALQQKNESMLLFNNELLGGSLSMTSFKIG